MKKILSMLMVFALTMLPFASLAEVATKTYTLADIGVTMNLPAGWSVATPATAANCSLNENFGLTEADTRAVLNAMGASLYGICDNFGITHVAVVTTPGFGMVDMTENYLNMDAFMKGFLTNYQNVTDSGYFKTDAAWFAFVRYTQPDASGNIDTIQYVTNVNGIVYVIQFMSMYGIELNDVNLGLFRQVVDSLRFTK